MKKKIISSLFLLSLFFSSSVATKAQNPDDSDNTEITIDNNSDDNSSFDNFDENTVPCYYPFSGT